MGAALLASESTAWRFAGAVVLGLPLLAAVKLAVGAYVALEGQTRQRFGQLGEAVAQLHADQKTLAALRASVANHETVLDELRAAESSLRRQLDAEASSVRTTMDTLEAALDECRRRLDVAGTVVDRLDEQVIEVSASSEATAHDLAGLARRQLPDREEFAALLQQTEPAFARLAGIQNEVLELGEAVERLHRLVARGDR